MIRGLSSQPTCYHGVDLCCAAQDDFDLHKHVESVKAHHCACRREAICIRNQPLPVCCIFAGLRTVQVSVLGNSHGSDGVGTVPNVFRQVKQGAAPVSDPPFARPGGSIAWELVNETVTDFPAVPEVPPWGCRMSQDVVSPAGYIDQYVPPDHRT